MGRDINHGVQGNQPLTGSLFNGSLLMNIKSFLKNWSEMFKNLTKDWLNEK